MKGDLYLSFVVLFQMIVTTIQLLLPLLGLASVETAASYRVIITLVTYIPAIIIVMRRRLGALLITFVVYFLLLLFSYTFFPESHRFIESSQSITLTPIAILTVLFMVSIRDFEYFKRMLLYIGRIAVVISFLYVIAHMLSPFRELDDIYDMSFGYSTLLPAMFLYTQRGYIDKLASFLLFAFIVIDGSRGPVIVLGIFYVYDTFFLSSGKTKLRMILVATIAAIAMLMILPKMDSFQESRTFYLLQEGELISHDSGRDEKVYSVIRPKIMEKPISGWGIGADRYLTGDGSYAHNIFYEVFIHYGVIFGSLLFVWFFVFCFRLYLSLRMRKIPGEKVLFIMMFLYGFIPKLVSGSYLIDISFAIFMGYLFSKKMELTRKPKLSCNLNRI